LSGDLIEADSHDGVKRSASNGTWHGYGFRLLLKGEVSPSRISTYHPEGTRVWGGGGWAGGRRATAHANVANLKCVLSLI